MNWKFWTWKTKKTKKIELYEQYIVQLEATINALAKMPVAYGSDVSTANFEGALREYDPTDPEQVELYYIGKLYSMSKELEKFQNMFWNLKNNFVVSLNNTFPVQTKED